MKLGVRLKLRAGPVVNYEDKVQWPKEVWAGTTGRRRKPHKNPILTSNDHW